MCLCKLKSIIFFLCLFATSCLWADPSLLTTAKQAERLFFDKLYSDAIPLYSQLLTFQTEEELRSQLALRLATCYLEEQQPQKALALLSPLTGNFRPQGLYLMSLAHRQLGESSNALSLLQQCSLCNDSQRYNNFIALEQGYHFIQIRDFTNAQRVLKSIPWQANHSLPYYLAQLNLAKIDLMTHQWDSALQTLLLLSHYLPQQHVLNNERIYLQGWLLLAKHQNSQAAACFDELLAKALGSTSEWPCQVLNGLIMSYLRQVLLLESSKDQVQLLLSKVEKALQQLLTRAPTETSYLLLSDFYLIKAKRLSDSDSYVKAQQLLERQDLFSSLDGHREALLKCAEAAPSYQERNQLYERLSRDSEHPKAFARKVWLLKGLNHFEEGLKSQKEQALNTMTWQFEEAAQAFAQAILIGGDLDLELSPFILKYQALAFAYQHPVKAQQAWQVITQLIADPSFLSAFESPQEMYCLAAWIALHLDQNELLQQVKVLLQQGETDVNCSMIWKERCLKFEGLIHLQLEQWLEADALFVRLLQDYPHSSSCGETWFWRAYGADQQKNHLLRKEYLQQVYTQDPQSAYAPLAYFHLYSYQDYIQGQRKALKHLQAMPLLFPSHPLLITAHYLIGLNHKKDYLSEEGQILRRKDWIAAIEAFESSESTFDHLFENNFIPSSQLSYYTQVRYRAQLERAQANLAIAKSSRGGKKQIYLEYAEGVFKQLIQEFNSPSSLAWEHLVHSLSPYPKVWAEAEFKLAQTYEEKKWWEEAETTLNESLKHYQQAQVTQGYGLMRVWYEKGKLAQRQENEKIALQYFIEAEKATPGHMGLSPHEKLDLWIQQSLCCKALNQLDEAMRLLSRVINDDVISPLRIKAMFLRAEIYELQGRPELAIKQLEATASKGGEWAQKAQEKLEQIYGY